MDEEDQMQSLGFMREELTKCIKATVGLMMFALGVYMIIQANLGAA